MGLIASVCLVCCERYRQHVAAATPHRLDWLPEMREL